MAISPTIILFEGLFENSKPRCRETSRALARGRGKRLAGDVALDQLAARSFAACLIGGAAATSASPHRTCSPVNGANVAATNVLETTFCNAAGTVRVTDPMPIHPRTSHGRGYDVGASRRVLRLLEGVSGEADQ